VCCMKERHIVPVSARQEFRENICVSAIVGALAGLYVFAKQFAPESYVSKCSSSYFGK